MLPYLFPDLAAFAKVADLITHLRTSDARYRAALPTEDHFLSLCPTELTVDLLEERLATAEKSILVVGASHGDRRTPFFEGCSPVPLLPFVASAAAIDLVFYPLRTSRLTKRREPESRTASPESRPESPVRAVRTGRRVPRQRPPPVPGTHPMTLRPSTAPQRVPLPSPPESSLPALTDPESDSLRAASPTVTRLLATVVTDPSLESTTASALVSELVDFAACCRLDYAASLVAESASVFPPSVG
ncbi:unnamed protein product, partial [Closterium sp. NIES-54]